MALKYLMDENIDPIYPTQIRSKQIGLIIRVIGEPSIPAKGTKDPEILEWCEKYDFILVTNNRKSMPVHLNEFASQSSYPWDIYFKREFKRWAKHR